MIKNLIDLYRSRILYKLALIFVVVVLIAIESVAFITLQISKRALETTTQKALLEKSSAISTEINFFIASREKVLSSLNNSLNSVDAAKQQKYLELFLKSSPSIDYLAILDSQGKTTAEAYRSQKDIEDTSLLLLLGKSKKWIVLNQNESRILYQKKNSLLFKEMPGFPSEQNLNLIARMNLSRLQNIIESASRDAKTNVFILSPEGNLLLRSKFEENGAFESIEKLDSFEKMKQKRYGTSRFNDANGNPQFAAFIEEPNWKWKIIVFESQKNIFSKLKGAETNTLIFALVASVLTVFVGIFLAYTIERPIREVTKGTAQLTKGNLDYQIKLNNIDEIGTLANSFNKMASQLKETQEKLVKAERVASISQMTVTLKHEINNPLTSILMSIQYILKRCPQIDREIIDALKIAESETLRIKNILLKLRKLSDPIIVDYLPGVKMIKLEKDLPDENNP